jgi:ribulose-5-phosphate 4-epimerase/fuculose-1-phosphate aldolase
MSLKTLQLNPGIDTIPSYLLEKHYMRKHGKNAYYGQGNNIRNIRETIL